jgi:eukaryotic-like serine/threonine-protein kinase
MATPRHRVSVNMSPLDRWADVKAIFQAALERNASGRAAFLDAACGDDAALRREVERLLAAHDDADSQFLEPPVVPDDAARLEETRTTVVTLRSGTRVGPYELRGLIGVGGMGEVYRAHDPRIGRDVAVKVLPAALGQHTDRLQRFQQEVRSAGALNHPNIITVHDVGTSEGLPYVVTELLEGRTLRAVIAPGAPLPDRAALDYTRQIAVGLAAAHAKGIVHRDLKPENLFVLDDGRVKILDFGLAKLVAPEAMLATVAGGTAAGMILGTVGYMAPEQARGQPVDQRADIFAFGAILYEMLTGIRAFQRDTPADTLSAILHAEPAPLEPRVGAAPSGLAPIVRRCLEKDPSKRFQSGSELARALEALPSVAGESDRRLAPGRWRARSVALARRRFVMAGAAIGLAALAVAVWLSNRAPHASDRPMPPLVAVRSFRNLSADPSQSYFAAGVTEEIRGQLSKMSALRLLSRAAVDKYGESNVPQMVHDLGVGNIVEGTVRRERERVRITVEVIDARNQQTLWSEQYDRELADVFAVQSDVALRIAQSLRATLSVDERARVQKRPTENLEAYELYLRATQMAGADRAKRIESIELLKKALDLDPRFAMAKARLAYRTLGTSYSGDLTSVDQAIVLAKEAAILDPTLASPHVVLGTAATFMGQDAQGRLSFLRALDLDPNDSNAMDNLSILDGQSGRLDEGLHWARRAFGLSAKEPFNYYHVAVGLNWLRDDATTWRWLTEAERRFPTYGRVQIVLAWVEFWRGQSSAALARMRTAAEKAPTDDELASMLADIAWLTSAPDVDVLTKERVRMAPAASGWAVNESARTRYAFLLTKRGESANAATLLNDAEQAVLKLLKTGTSPYALIELAAVRVMRGDRVAALDCLTRSYDNGFRDYDVIAQDPMFAPLRADAAFQMLIQRMKADVAEQRGRAAERGLLNLSTLVSAQR